MLFAANRGIQFAGEFGENNSDSRGIGGECPKVATSMKIKGLKRGFSFAKVATSLKQSQLIKIWKSGIRLTNWLDTLSAMRIPNSRSNVILIQILNKHRKELDARFAEMSLDPDCRKEANLRAREFGGSDGETAKLLEG